MSETAETTANRRLFFGGLANSVTTHQLADAVMDFHQVSIALFKPNGRTRGGTFAFVTFETDADADRALTKFKDLEIGGRPVSIERTEPGKRKSDDSKAKQASSSTKDKEEPKLAVSVNTESSETAKPKAQRRKLPLSNDSVYISNIPLEVTSEEVAELFTGYPDAQITIVTKEPRKRRVGGKFVTLAAKSYAFAKIGANDQEKAIEELNGKEWKGSEITVSKATVSPDDVEE